MLRTAPLLRTIAALGGLATALAVPLLAVSLAVPAPIHAATHVVSIVDDGFSPSTLTIAAGDTVTWRNDDDRPHTVTAGDGSFDSGNLDPGQTFTMTFSVARSGGYVCVYHPDMVGTLTVTAAGGGAPAAPATTPAPAAPSVAPRAAATDAGGHAAGTGTAGTTPPRTGADARTHQPDTALGLPETGGVPAWLPLLLIGLGLVAFAAAVVPGLGRPAERSTVGLCSARTGAPASRGWRR